MMDAAAGATMNAWRQSRYGGPEAVGLDRVEVPVLARGAVLIAVRASGGGVRRTGSLVLVSGEGDGSPDRSGGSCAASCCRSLPARS